MWILVNPDETVACGWLTKVRLLLPRTQRMVKNLRRSVPIYHHEGFRMNWVVIKVLWGFIEFILSET